MSNFKISNQIPVNLSPDYSKFEKLKDPGDPAKLLESAISNQILNKGANISISANNKTKNVKAPDITQLLLDCLTNQVNPTTEKLAKDLLSQTVLDYQNSNFQTVRLLYAQIAGNKYKLPIPTPSLVYTETTDIIPACKSYLAGQASNDFVFANFAYTFKPKTLGIGFKNTNSFTNFKLWLAPKINVLANKLSADTNTKFSDLQKEDLTSLTLNFQLRTNDTDDQEPYSFSRVLINMLQLYSQTHQDCFLMPFDLGETFNPRTLILVNIENHAHASATRIKKAWTDIKNSTQTQIKILSNKHLNHLPSIGRQKSAIKQQLQNVQQAQQTSSNFRGRFTGFSTKRPTTVQLTNKIIKILKHMSDVNSSSNIYKQIKRSFNKPNRRHPDDFNLAGKITSTSYRPDLHIYLDTSGSISEENYESAIKSCIYLAKKLNINLYFNSFSHYLSQSVMLPLHGKSPKQSYYYFQKIPKAQGGTCFLNVYKYIQASKKRRKELSILITDFGDLVPNEDFVFPKNLYMIPIDYADYRLIHRSATYYAESAITSGHPEIPNHMLL